VKYLFSSIAIVIAMSAWSRPAQASFIVQAPRSLGLTNGLVGWWTFDGKDLSGVQAYDRSGNGNRGTLTNGPTRTIGKLGQGLSFDGVDDFVKSNSSTSLNNLSALTISAWMYPRTADLNAAIAEKGTPSGVGWNLQFTTNSRLDFTRKMTGGTLEQVSAGGSVTANRWQHVVVTWNGGATGASARIYVNGTETSYDATFDASGGITDDSAESLGIGRRADDFSQGFNGLLDDVRIYTRALSKDEIKRLYNMGGTVKLNTTLEGPKSGFVGGGRLMARIWPAWRLPPNTP
jgi:hypothetical protein